ncbi:MAG: PIN domain-containing protein [Thermoplasmatota archaeon]
MKIADTSFLVAMFDADDHRNAEAAAAFAKTNPVLIGPEVLVETLGVIKAKVGRNPSSQVLEDLMALPNVEWTSGADVPDTYRIYREEKSLSYVDAAVVHHAVARRMGALTYDSAQTRALERRLKTR